MTVTERVKCSKIPISIPLWKIILDTLAYKKLCIQICIKIPPNFSSYSTLPNLTETNMFECTEIIPSN